MSRAAHIGIVSASVTAGWDRCRRIVPLGEGTPFPMEAIAGALAMARCLQEVISRTSSAARRECLGKKRAGSLGRSAGASRTLTICSVSGALK
ncbi:hypothetical protein [Sinorhizobium sp. BG8]|uniref:hypothetical protein n=1 Tax=Sinorhizobium sp. BG8 TaxID=2613773 RepID=UPI00193E6711|nr:hypothetical protein [Sinorhizobium sp. BG8]QRM56313.1 hypothetical protein F3Y30_18560 [Sinorhizobium sp. BG8]